jgi:hypothetical protein
LLDKSVNNLSQRLDKLYPDTINSNSSDGIKDGLQYFPDDYFEWMFPLGIPEDLKEEANKWYSDYIELMEYRRNPRIGRTKCFWLPAKSRRRGQCFIHWN